MIWVWALAAVILSLLVVRKKKIKFHHLIWTLLPIDMYGITISGAIIKPYMVFAFIILIISLYKYRGKLVLVRVRPEWFLGLIALLCMMLFSDMFNNGGLASLRQHLMFILVFICAWIYTGSIETEAELDQIKDIIIGTAIGYGLIYLFAVIVNQAGINFDGISTWTREQPGLILKFIDIPDGRLRGFLLDPNLIITSLLPPIAISIHNLFILKDRRSKRIFIIQIAVSILCVYFTKSRMALISTLLIIGFSVASGLKFVSQSRKVHYFSFLLVVASLLLIVVFFLPDSILGQTFTSLVQQYEGRASFNSQYGREVLWKSAWNILESNNLIWGVGQGQVRYYGELDCHNTWLEWMVGSGLITGILVILYFMSIYIRFSVACKFKHSTLRNIPTWFGIKWGYFGIVLSLVSVDNITNSNLIFFASLMMWLLNVQMAIKDTKKSDFTDGFQ